MLILTSTIGFLFSTVLLVVINNTKSADVTIEELKELNIMCDGMNSCQRRTKGGLYDLTEGYSCHCDSACYQLGTCCLDSPFRKQGRTKHVASCRSVDEKKQLNYYMIDKCPPNSDANNAFQKDCERKKYSEADLMLRVPVTSLSSNLTYKNYFCFRCYETSDDYIFWKVKLHGSNKEVVPKYSKTKKVWFLSFPGNVIIEAPVEILSLPRRCFPRVISMCPENWPKNEVRRKCGMYMSLIRGKDSERIYRNPHCALCNSEDLENYACKKNGDHMPSWEMRPSFPVLLSHLINIQHGDVENKKHECNGDSVWDPFFKKCRKLMCALRRYVVKRGKCVPP